MSVPAPPVSGLTPRLVVWKPNRILFRVHSTAYAANAFNPGFGTGRFHPIVDASGNPIPTLYAANQINGALAETLFHNRLAGDIIFHAELIEKCLSRLLQKQALSLIDLTGFHLRRLGLKRSQLLEADETFYRVTARWAEALHQAAPKAHGMVWVSRQFDTAKSVLLFGDRVSEVALEPSDNTQKLDTGSGLRLVQKAASAADITLAIG